MPASSSCPKQPVKTSLRAVSKQVHSPSTVGSYNSSRALLRTATRLPHMHSTAAPVSQSHSSITAHSTSSSLSDGSSRRQHKNDILMINIILTGAHLLPAWSGADMRLAAGWRSALRGSGDADGKTGMSRWLRGLVIEMKAPSRHGAVATREAEELGSLVLTAVRLFLIFSSCVWRPQR